MKSFTFLLFAMASLVNAQPYDVVIRNGHIIDGTGSPWYSAISRFKAGASRLSGSCAAATKGTIDAHGMVVAPGFIDMLGQSETYHSGESSPSVQNLPGHHDRDHGRRRFGRATQRRDDSAARPRATNITASSRIGTRCASISRALKNRAWGSTWRVIVGATSVRRMVIGDDNRAPTADASSIG